MVAQRSLLASILTITSFYTIPSQAQTNNQDIINQQDWIGRQQQNQIHQQRRLKEIETNRKERERREKDKKQEQKALTSISGKTSKCFTIKTIALTGADSLSTRQKNKIISPFLGRCVDVSVLTEAITAVQTYYNNKGYIAARAVIPKQNIQSGNLELEILEGKINKIIIGDDNFTDKMQKISAFGFLEGDSLNLKDINQGIYQMNRLPSNNATMKVVPAKEEGAADILISNKNKFPARAKIEYDNLGNEFSGIKRSSFNGSLDNMLFLNDSISLSYHSNLNDDSKQKDIKSFSTTIAIPFGYNSFSYSYSRSEFKGQSGSSTLTGYSQNSNIDFDRVLFTEGNLKIIGNSSLATKSSASYLSLSKLETSERNLSIGSIGFTISNYFENGINLYLKPSYYKGLKILDAKKDQKNLNNDIAKAQFDYFKLYASVSKRLTIPKYKIPFSIAAEIDSQYAKQTLFGTEQFAVGGYYSIRGFRENYITGDSVII